MSGARTTALFAVIAGAVAFCAFLGSLGNEFIWDDPIVLDRQLPFFDSAQNIFFPPKGIPQFGADYYRPLIVVSYLVDEGIAKAFWPLERRDTARRITYHASPVVLHAVTAVLVFLLSLSLLEALWPDDRPRRLIALAAALLFAVHPIHSESVAWMAGCSDVVCGLFFFGSAIAFVRYRRGGGRVALAGCLALAFAAMLSKETGLGLVALLPTLSLLVPRTMPAPVAPAGRTDRKRAPPRQPSAPIVRRTADWLAWLGLGGVVVLYFVLRQSAIGAFQGQSVAAAEFREGLSGTALHMVGAVGWYVLKVVWPPPQSAFVTDYTESLPGFVPAGLLVVLGAVLPLALVVTLALRRSRQRFALELAAGALFFAGLGMSVFISVYHISKTPIAERYLYIPSAGVCLLVAALMDRLGGWTSRRFALPLATPLVVVALISAGAAAVTTHRAAIWRSNLPFWVDAVAKAPQKGVPHLHLGLTYVEMDKLPEAEEQYRLALRYYDQAPGRAKAHNDLGALLMRKGLLDEAAEHFTAALREDPHYDTPHFNLALTLLGRTAQKPADQALNSQASAEALAHLETALAINPRYVKAHLRAGLVLIDLGRRAEGVDHLRRVIELAPASNEAREARSALAKVAVSASG